MKPAAHRAQEAGTAARLEQFRGTSQFLLYSMPNMPCQPLTVVHTDGQALCVAHPSTVCEEHVWALLPLLEHPGGQGVLVVPMEAERHLQGQRTITQML